MDINSNAPRKGIKITHIQPENLGLDLRKTSIEAKPLFPVLKFESVTLPISGATLIKDLLPMVGVGVFYGDSQAYKTFVALDLLVAIASGRTEYGGRRIKKSGAVVYIAAEGQGGIGKRVAGIRKQLPHSEIPFYLIPARPRLGIGVGDKVALLHAIKSVVPEGTPIVALVVDTFAQCLAGADENGSGTQTILGNLNDISNELRCNVIAIHHGGKDQQKGPRGHSSLIGNTDFCWRFKRVRPLVCQIVIEKIKDEENNRRFEFHLKKVHLGSDQDGDLIDTLVVKSIQEITVEKNNHVHKRLSTTGVENAFMEFLKSEKLNTFKKAISPDANGVLVDAFPMKNVRDLFIHDRLASNPNIKSDSARKEFDRVRHRLIESNLLNFAEVDGETYLFKL